MKRLLFVLFVSVLFISCASRRHVSKFTPLPLSFPYEYATSAPFLAFWNELADEVNAVGDWSKYSPSEHLVLQYALNNETIMYRVNGTLKVDNTFRNQDFEKIDCRLQKITEEIYMYPVPLQSLQEMLNQSGITYVEIAQRNVLGTLTK